MAYLMFLLGAGVWAARCPDCSSGDWSRVGALVFVGILFGFITVATFVAIGLGMLLALAYQRARARREA